jgi:hypothetical protein
MSGRKVNELAKKYAGLANVRGRALPALGAAAAAAALAVVGTAGCSVFQPQPAPAGMQKQILNGERVGAATRAGAKPAAKSALPANKAIPGSDVTAIGDSVMSGSAPTLAMVMPGIYIDAKPDRQMPAGLDIVRQLAESGKLRPILVMGLGTNNIVTTAQLNQLVKIIGPHRKLVLINTYVPDGWSKQVNATDAAYVHQHPNVVLADWYDTIKNRLNLLWPDQVHPEMPGTIVYAHMVDEAVQATRTISGTTPPAQPVIATENGVTSG